jgi:3,5-epimerase/4-reductase
MLLIFGGKGWIGSQFCKLLKSEEYILSSYRADDTENIEKEIKENNITHIVSFIGRTRGPGYTTIDFLENKDRLKDNLNDNLYCPLSLAFLSLKYNLHYTYMGTGCIFAYENIENLDLNKEHKYSEEDKPNFTGSAYSTVKGYTDSLFHNEIFQNNVLNVRIRMPITAEDNDRNFITKITTYEKICSIPNSMTVLPELLPYLLEMIKRNEVGTINLCNPGVIEHNEILSMYKEIIDPNFTWKNFSIQEQDKILLSKRSNNYLSTEKLESLFPVKPIKESVRDILYQMKENREK